MAAFKLLSKERILLYLADHAGEQLTPPTGEDLFALTQAGIADALGYSLERISTNIKHLEKEGLIKRKKWYSRKTGRFKNFYFLAQGGTSRSEEIKKMLDRERIKVLDLDEKLKEMNICEIINYLKWISKSKKRVQNIGTYKLKKAARLEISYTNILNNISGDMIDLRTLIEPKIFEINTRMWSRVRDAYYDMDNNYVVLTEPKNWQGGVIWLNRGIKSPFMAEFRYRVGGGTGGDGFVFMFYKEKGYWPCDGGNLGFVSGQSPVPGYGIEFDGFFNPDYGDPPYPHIALIKDHVNNHLKHVKDGRVKDFKWHKVKVVVAESAITVHIDERKMFEWKGMIDRTHSGLGFAGSTGGLNNWHIIDDVKITKIATSRAS